MQLTPFLGAIFVCVGVWLLRRWLSLWIENQIIRENTCNYIFGRERRNERRNENPHVGNIKCFGIDSKFRRIWTVSCPGESSRLVVVWGLWVDYRVIQWPWRSLSNYSCMSGCGYFGSTINVLAGNLKSPDHFRGSFIPVLARAKSLHTISLKVVNIHVGDCTLERVPNSSSNA